MIPEIRGTYEKTGESFRFPASACGEAPELSVFAERMASLSEYRKFVFSDEAEFQFIFKDAAAEKEGSYTLDISPERIVISSADEAGRAYALTTLFALIRDGSGILECGIIRDVPRYVYRGFLLDCSRHFFTADAVKKMLEQAALNKISRFHWHISDDQGYRLESRVFPELNTVSSFRDDPADGEHYGGFYTFDEVRDIVEYAKLRGIEVIPEIDMPGHISAILRAHPELSCREEPVGEIAAAGIYDVILCAGKDSSIGFIKKLLDEVCELFPYEAFHIGGDEAPKTEWCKCDNCQARIRDLGLRDEDDLQAWFSNQIADYLISKGKRPICWNEALKSEQLDESVIVQYWDEDADPAMAYCSSRLSRGYKWIYSYTHQFYFDFEPSLCPMRKMGMVSNRFRSGSIIPDDKLLGYECTLWSENISTEERLHQLSFPRMFAMAEAAWHGLDDYAGFLGRCEKEISFSKASGIHTLSIDEADPSPEIQKTAVAAEWSQRVKMVKDMGMDMYLPAITALIRDKLEGCLSAEEIDELLNSIMS